MDVAQFQLEADRPLDEVRRHMYFVYFAKSLKNNKIYVGFSSKIPSIRVMEHNQSSNKWSKSNAPLKLIYYERYLCKADAMQREKYYKSGIGKRAKLALVNEFDK